MSTLYGKSCWSAMRRDFLAITQRPCSAPRTRQRNWFHFDRIHSRGCSPSSLFDFIGALDHRTGLATIAWFPKADGAFQP